MNQNHQPPTALRDSGPTSRGRRGRRRTGAALVIAALLALPLNAPSAVAAPVTADGASQETAAASCYEVKKNNPEAKSGAYWLYTPAMEAPQQFYCDQETDGGGWVMIGRGRENWKETYAGTGSPQDLVDHPDGTAAFTTAQLPSTTVDGLLNGQAPEKLQDGIRLRRALNSTGTDWQEVRMHREKSPYWNWTFRSNTPVGQFSFSNPGSGKSCEWWQPFCTSSGSYGASYSGTGKGTGSRGADQYTEYFGQPNNKSYNRVLFRESEDQGYVTGFGYDSGVKAPTVSSGIGQDKDSYLWSKTRGWAQPFTQMYLRPQLTQDDIAPLQTNDQGVYPASSRRALPNSGAEKTTWGATGYANGRRTEMNTQVQAFAQVGNTMFIGGNFSALTQGSPTGETFDQSYVAGLDVDTGEPVRGFRPRVNGQIKSLAQVDGKIAIGGEFTQVNGEDRAGFAVLDPVTGEVAPEWADVRVENRTATGVVQVKGLTVRENQLYLAGSFTHTSGPGASSVYARNAVRINTSTRTPDRAWSPTFNGTVNGISASSNGSSLYAAGYFSQVHGSDAFRLASVNTSDGAQTKEWNYEPSYRPRSTNVMWGFQFAVNDTEDGNVWVGGTEHMLHWYNGTTLERQGSSIARDGGDFQSVSHAGRNVYGSCHCGDWAYQGASTFDPNTSSWSVVNELSLIGAWDADTGNSLPEFNPNLKGPGGWGVWASTTDSRGVLWAGGSIDKSTTVSGTPQWSSGFVRFAPRDVEAPSTPGTASVSAAGDQDRISWSAVAEKGVTYQVIRNGRVIGSTTQTALEVGHQDDAVYAVRAMDGSRNYSASTSGLRVGEATPGAEDPQPSATATAAPSDSGTATPSETAEPSASETVTPSASATPTATAPAVDTELVGEKDEWEYRQGTSAPAADWNAEKTRDTDGWSTGAAPLGWGSKDLGTTIERDASRPLSTYFRKSVTLPKGHGDLVLKTWADDGIVVYANGREVNRTNMKEGAVTQNSYALAAPRTATARQNPITVTIPAADLPEEGTVVLSAEVHGNYRSTLDSSFGMTATLKAARNEGEA